MSETSKRWKNIIIFVRSIKILKSMIGEEVKLQHIPSFNKNYINKKIKVLNNQKYSHVKSFDCPMESTLIVNDILESFLNYNGKVKKL